MKHDDREERELHDLARQLGAGGAADRLDATATAEAVIAKLRVRRTPVRWAARATVWLSAAALIVAVAGGGLMLRGVRPHAESAPPALVAGNVLLTDLSTDELREALRTLDHSLDEEPVAAETELDDLTAPELRRLLQSLEG